MPTDKNAASPQAPRRIRPIALVLLATILYAAAATIMVYLARHGINPDGVAYLRIARYYAEGRLDYALNSYWGPLLSWLLVPAFRLHIDPVFLCKSYGVALGFLLALATLRFARRIEDRRGGWAAYAAVLFFAVSPAIYVTPDLLLGVLIVAYLAMSARLVRDQVSPVACFATGLMGGIAFLAKSYALPFVVAHLGMTAVLRFLLIRRDAARKPLVLPFVLTALGFAALAGPWIAIMSAHEGRFTISSAGKISHAWTLEKERAQRGLPIYDLHRPREGRVTGWENPPEMNAEWPTWSMFDGLGGLKKQIKFCVLNGHRILRYFHRSTFGVAYVGIGVAFLLIFFPLRNVLDSQRSVMRLWALATIAIYCGGYDLVLFKPRYFWPIMGPVMALSLQAFDSIFYRETSDLPGAPERSAQPLRSLYGIFATILIATMLMQTTLDLKYAAEEDGHRALENWIEFMNDRLEVEGPLVSNQWDIGLYVAYFRELPYNGGYHGANAKEVASELTPYGPLDVLVFFNENLAQSMQDHPAFTLRQELGRPCSGCNLWVFRFQPPAKSLP